MTLAEEFTLDEASVIGRLHVAKHVNNQDSHVSLYNEDFFISCVSDGCSGSPHSEVGSYLTSRKLVDSMLSRLEMVYNPTVDTVERFLEEARLDTIAFLRSTASSLGHASAMMQDSLLATASGFVVTPEITIIYSIGDGVFFINNYEVDLDNEQAQYPDMLIYGAMDPETLKITHQGKFNYVTHPTKDVDTVLVATDGFRYVLDSEGKPIPGAKDLVPPLAELYQQPIKPLLRRMGREVRRAQYDKDLDIVTQDVHKSLLLDDTTVVILKRNDNGTVEEIPRDGEGSQ